MNINLENHGKIWEVEHDQKLTSLFNEGRFITYLCEALGRSPYTIVQRMCDLKLIYFDTGTNMYMYRPTRFVSMFDVSKLNKEYR